MKINDLSNNHNAWLNETTLGKELQEAGGRVPRNLVYQGGQVKKDPAVVAANKRKQAYQAYLRRKAAKEKEQGVAEGLDDNDQPWHGIDDPELLQDLIADAKVMDYDEFYDTHSSLLDDPGEFWENYHDSLEEGSNNIGAQIKAAYQKIYDQGDDAIEFMYYDSPIFAQYWDEYEGDLDSIIAEVDPNELQIILDELEAAAEDQGVNEVSNELRNRYVARASDDYGSANFAARASKSHPGLEDYSKEQEERAKKRAEGLGRALSDKRTGRVSEGPFHNPGQEDSPVASAITRRILLQRTDLLSKYGPEAVGQAIDDVSDYVGDFISDNDEIGSSDVSGWVKQVERILSEMNIESVNEFRDEYNAFKGTVK